MPDYVTMSDLNGLLPGQFIKDALDDDQDGVADPVAWAALQASVAKEINGRLGQRYTTPFANPVPAIVLSTAIVLALSGLHQRRGIADDKNPFAKQRDAALAKLDLIASGKEPLSPDEKRAKPSASIVTERARLASRKPANQQLSV